MIKCFFTPLVILSVVEGSMRFFPSATLRTGFSAEFTLSAVERATLRMTADILSLM